MIWISQIRFQNLRGYTDAVLDLNSKHLTIVGDNNQGKSSALLLLDFILNVADRDVLSDRRFLNPGECDLLLPANDARHQARRITLQIQFGDYRTRRRYLMPGENSVQLRLSLKKKGLSIRLNLGHPKISERHDPKALELLNKIRNYNTFLLIPSDRSPGSPWFNQKLDEALKAELSSRMKHYGQGGTTREYRETREAIRSLDRLANSFGIPLWQEIKNQIPPAIVRSGSIQFPIDSDKTIDWFASLAKLRLSTGRHDERSVKIGHVGTGLQSLIGLSLGIRNIASRSQFRKIIAVEEPEMNLHPGAQRATAVLLRKFANESGRQAIITTHSPYFLDEAKFGETVIVRNRRYYQPKDVGVHRSEINTALMNVSSAELFFAKRVLFVEGPGDKAIFDTLFRRIRMIEGTDHMWGVSVQSTGSKNSFAPWIRILRSYGETGDRPIRWMMLFDSDAASSALLRCLQDCGYSNAASLNPICQRIITHPLTSIPRLRETERLNRKAIDYRAHLFPCDLEWAIVHSSSPIKQSRIVDVWNGVLRDEGVAPLVTASDIANKLGSAAGSGNGMKAPHLRYKFAQRIAFEDLPDQLEAALHSILKRLFNSSTATQILALARAHNPTLP